MNNSAIMSMIVSDTVLGSMVVKKAWTYTGYEASLIKLNQVVQDLMHGAVSRTYGEFGSPNSPIITNKAVLGLVKEYIYLMPVHHASIMTMLNVDQKVKDKRSLYLVSQYNRLSF